MEVSVGFDGRIKKSQASPPGSYPRQVLWKHSASLQPPWKLHQRTSMEAVWDDLHRSILHNTSFHGRQRNILSLKFFQITFHGSVLPTSSFHGSTSVPDPPWKFFNVFSFHASLPHRSSLHASPTPSASFPGRNRRRFSLKMPDGVSIEGGVLPLSNLHGGNHSVPQHPWKHPAHL